MISELKIETGMKKDDIEDPRNVRATMSTQKLNEKNEKVLSRDQNSRTRDRLDVVGERRTNTPRPSTLNLDPDVTSMMRIKMVTMTWMIMRIHPNRTVTNMTLKAKADIGAANRRDMKIVSVIHIETETETGTETGIGTMTVIGTVTAIETGIATAIGREKRIGL